MELEILADAAILIIMVFLAATIMYYLSILYTYLDAYRIASQNICSGDGHSSVTANVCIRLLPNGSVLKTVVGP